jgi:hypothetical protein
MKLHHVCLGDQSQAKRAQGHAVFNPDIPPGFPVLLMDPFMHNPAFGCEEVFGPCLLNMDQGALALTKRQVLEAG